MIDRPQTEKKRSKNMKKSEKQQIRRYVENQYAHVNGRNVRCHCDGSVWVYVDKMPRTNEPGRIFAGWDTWLLEEAKQN